MSTTSPTPCAWRSTDLDGHEVFYIASPDNAGGRDLKEAALPLRRSHRGQGARPPRRLRHLLRQAERLLGYAPTRSWRDYLDDDGRLRPEIAGCLQS